MSISPNSTNGYPYTSSDDGYSPYAHRRNTHRTVTNEGGEVGLTQHQPRGGLTAQCRSKCSTATSKGALQTEERFFIEQFKSQVE